MVPRIHGPLASGTDRSDLIQDLLNFLGPGPSRSWISQNFESWCGPKFLNFLSWSGARTGPERTAWSWYSRFWAVDPWVVLNVCGHVRELQTQIQFLKSSVLVDFVDFILRKSVIHQSRRFKEIIHRIIWSGTSPFESYRLLISDESSDLFSRMKFLDSVVCFPHLVRSEHIWR